jgi:hypothetical protein
MKDTDIGKEGRDVDDFETFGEKQDGPVVNDVYLASTSQPSPRRVRLDGKIDVVRASDASFTLIADDGRVIQGRLVGRSIEELAGLLNRAILIFGTGQFDSFGKLISVEADGFLPRENSLPNAPSLPRRTSEEREEMARRLKSVIGTWPGAETDEEIEQTLRGLK